MISFDKQQITEQTDEQLSDTIRVLGDERRRLRDLQSFAQQVQSDRTLLAAAAKSAERMTADQRAAMQSVLAGGLPSEEQVNGGAAS